MQYKAVKQEELSDFIATMRPVLILIMCLVHLPYLQSYDGSLIDVMDYRTLFGPFLKDTFARGAVPLLTVISGYLVYFSYSKRSYAAYFGSKVSSLLVPFVFWNFLLALLLYGIYRYAGFPRMIAVLETNGVWENIGFILGLGKFPVNYPLYFLKDLFIIATLFPLLLSRVRALPVIALMAVLLLWYSIHNSAVMLGGNIIIFRSDMLFFFVFGYAIAKFRLADRLPAMGTDSWFLLLAFFVFSAIAAALLARYSPGLHFYTTKIKPLLAIAFLFLVPAVIELLGRHRGSRFVRVARRLSKYSFTLFLVHGPVGFLLIYLIQKNSIAIGNTSPIWAQTLLVIVFLSVSFVFAFLIANAYWLAKRAIKRALSAWRAPSLAGAKR